MLERIREGAQGPWAMIIIGLVVLSFVFAGVGSYLTSGGSDAVATVNGEDISASELERAYQNQRARMESQYGEGVSALFANEGYLQEFRRNVLERLIGEKLISQKAKELGLRVSDDQIKQTILEMPEFQTDGKFDNERYLLVLRQSGYQASGFRDYLRVQMTREQLSRAIGATGFALPSEMKTVYDLQQQTRDARYITVDAAPFAADVTVGDDEVQAYYDANITSFDTDERVNVSYVLLNRDDLKADASVTEQEISDYYDSNKASYSTKEERRVSHILVEFGDDEDAAKAKADALHAKLEDGADFAELAKQESADTFSAENGGDLDFITADSMDPAFDAAAFSLANVGDISDVVRTDFGFHIIKMTDIKPADVTPLADVKDEIKDKLLTDKATDRFYELQNRMAEVAFEVPDTLEDVAGVVNGSIQETGFFSRQTAPVPMDVDAAITAAFSDELVKEGVNSEVIELSPNSVAVMRVNAHEPQRTQSLDEVKDGIVATLRAQKAQQAAEAWSQTLVAKLDEGEDVTAMLEEKGLAWQSAEKVGRNGGEMARNMVTALFRLSPEAGKNVDVTPLVSGNVGIVQLTAVNHAEAMPESTVSAMQNQMAGSIAQVTYQNYVDALRKDAEVTVKQGL